jgi:hypothetical protein
MNVGIDAYNSVTVVRATFPTERNECLERFFNLVNYSGWDERRIMAFPTYWVGKMSPQHLRHKRDLRL